MVLIDLWTEWHLTPRGWESGARRVDLTNVEERPSPKGSVAIYRYRELHSPLFAMPEWSVERVHLDETDATFAQLVARFGPCPRQLSGQGSGA